MSNEAGGGERLHKLRWEKLKNLRTDQSGGAYVNDLGALPRTPLWQVNRQYRAQTREDLNGEQVFLAVVGRILNRRGNFLVVCDGDLPDSQRAADGDGGGEADAADNRIQLYIDRKGGRGAGSPKKRTGDFTPKDYLAIDDWDIGDIVSVCGRLQRSGKGDLYINLEKHEKLPPRVLAKCLHPLPEKYHGLRDREIRYRQRYLDLISNQESVALFRRRAMVLRLLRNFFCDEGFLEVETPMLQLNAGGAVARPFETRHEALDLPMFLRIAPELFLKRLIVGNMGPVFELNRCFRNEGLSTRHNPEFTMLELYQPWANHEQLMDLLSRLLKELAEKITGHTEFCWQEQSFNFAKIGRQSMMAAVLAANPELAANITEADLDKQLRAELADGSRTPPAELLEYHRKHCGGEAPPPGWGSGKLLFELFEHTVEKQLHGPIFITDYPTEISPLARSDDKRPWLSQRFELFVAGMELINGFSELNDPEEQRRRFEQQAKLYGGGDYEAMRGDDDYILALEYGMPPTAGAGIGVDRLVMLLTDSAAIRDVLLFPHMRPPASD